MDLSSIRNELTMYDNIIKNMITLRMSLIPIVADIKSKNNLPLFQAKREDEIYKNIKTFSKENGVDASLVTDIYKLIISNALNIEENVVKSPEVSVINKDVSVSKEVEDNIKKLDNILLKEIPEIISNITKNSNFSDLNLTEKATLYYNHKVNNEIPRDLKRNESSNK